MQWPILQRLPHLSLATGEDPDADDFEASHCRTGMERSPTSATGAGWETTPWHARAESGVGGAQKNRGTEDVTSGRRTLRPRTQRQGLTESLFHHCSERTKPMRQSPSVLRTAARCW